MIKIYDDKKEKSQSFEATIENFDHLLADFTGYGANEEEAKHDLLMKVEDIIFFLQKAKSELITQH